MRLALIPPISLLGTTFQTDYQLMLPQLVRNDEYARNFRLHCHDPQTYVILDNGAAEGYRATALELLHIAEDFEVDEIVLPDVIGNAEATLERSRAFLDQLAGKKRKFNTMFVCQGKDLFEFVDSADEAARWPEVTTIGIPRHALRTCDDDQARISIANILQSTDRFKKQIHFLGASSRWPSEAAILSDPKHTKQTQVRGMDTSMPFNFAFRKMDLQDGIVINRVADYFNLDERHFDAAFVQRQIYTFKTWARCRDNRVRMA